MPTPSTTVALWFLTGRTTQSDGVQHFAVLASPFHIGRRSDASLCLADPTISGKHAEIIQREDQIWVRDLQSTNGTYVNGVPVTSEILLHEGDLIQIANIALRVCRQEKARHSHTVAASEDAGDHALSLLQFEKLMSEQAVVPHFQPIVTIPQQMTVGYEILGRSRYFGLTSPRDMFLAASQLNLEAELSRMFRLAGIQEGATLPGKPALFLNTHPVELVDCGLLESLCELREINSDQPLTLEIHEAAVADAPKMKHLRRKLNDLEIGLAYDDFGAGQSRLVELLEVQPDCLKFDMKLIRDIHRAPPAQQQMIANLVRMTRDLGITPLAEGVECAEEGEACADLGFELAQGYFYGKPVSADIAVREADEQYVIV